MRRRERRRGDRQSDAGAAPVQLLGVDRVHDPRLVRPDALQVRDPVQAAGPRLADDVVRHALLAVAARGRRAHHVTRERVAVALELELIVGEAEVPVRRIDVVVHLSGTRYLAAQMRRRALLLAVLALSGATTLAACGGKGGGDGRGDTATQPTVGAKGSSDDAAGDLGFPAFATKNTTRVGGGDAIADAAGVARAVYPGPSVKTRPKAVTLVDSRD